MILVTSGAHGDRSVLEGDLWETVGPALERGDPRYQPVYDHPGCDDPIKQLEQRIKFADPESLSLFSGFRGSGKTTELFRLRKRLQEMDCTVLYADALD
jgi:hypothetical protein